MGVVYLARDARFDREVAVKVVHERLRSDPNTPGRFIDEGKITGRLQHPGIPPVHDLGTLPDGRPYLAMRLISGRTLAELLADRPDPAHDRGRFLGVVEQVCQTLAYTHGRGVIHRDLKPANVMVGSFGEVQVMDWGLAKDPVSRGRERPEANAPRSATPPVVKQKNAPGSPGVDPTAAGPVLGTPAYMPPEQARGETDRIGTRSDVFGLGAILCAVLTGKPPCGGDGVSALAAAQAGDGAAAFARLGRCGADPAVVALCRR